MENHPIPQDVTGFQFKLIGNMTVKQFAYLATGAVLAWVFFQLPINFLIKVPICSFLAILGIGLAFFPVSGRPMDLMIGNFIKALFRPTQFVYEKMGRDLYFSNRATFSIKVPKNSFNPLPQDKLKAYLRSQDLTPASNLAIPNASTLQANVFKPTPTPPVNNVVSPQPIIQPVVQKPYIPPASPIQQQQPKVAVKVNPMPVRGRVTGMPAIPDSPNLITGIVKDPRGNPLPNILVEVKDKEGNPVRAFKTNEVGRFASSTPLINGIYTLELEDPKGQNKFEVRSINITGQIILPIEIISIDTREELRRSLFNT